MVKNKYNIYIFILLIAGFLLRLWMITLDPFLHNWDEHFHALVAKNLSNNFALPILLNNPLDSYKIEAWCDNHIWLHKQPLFLWQIAVAIKVFGTSVFSVRFPSLLMTSISLLIIYRLAFLVTQDRKTSLIALILATFSNFQLNLISARIPTDHNDIAFGFYVLLSIWTFVEYLKSKKIYWVLLSGIFAGAAVLIKWLIGLLVYSSWGIISLYYIIKKKNYSLFIHLILSFIICLLIFIPWQIFTYYKFPTEFLFEHGFNQKHIVEVVEGHSGGYFFYIKNFRHYYGYLLTLFFLNGIWLSYKRKYFQNEIGFALIFYCVLLFSFFTFMVATKMNGFLYSILPIGLIYASISVNAFMQNYITKKVFAFLFISILVLDTLNPYDIWKRTYRSQEYTRKSHNTAIIKNADIIIPKDYNVVINLSDYENIDLMYYNKRPFAAYHGVFTVDELNKLLAQKVKIAAFADHGKYILPDYIKNYPFLYIIDKKLMD